MALGVEVGHGPGHIVLDGNPAPLPKRGRAPQFSAAHFYCGQTAVCIRISLGKDRGRPQPTRHNCVRWGPCWPSPKGAQPLQFSAIVRCGQTAGLTKMPLGMDVGLGPGDCVRWGSTQLPQKKGHNPQFSAHVYCDQTAG